MPAKKTPRDYFKGVSLWSEEIARLRKLLKETELVEEIKWGAPCYTFNGKPVVGIGAFKSYFGLWFFQGALLKDEASVLVNAQAGRTHAMRQWRMNKSSDIRMGQIRQYLAEAVNLAREGKEVKARRGKPVEIPAELATALKSNPNASQAFEKLSLGRRREYADYIADAKQEATKQRRLEKILPMVEAGIGLNDRYRR